MGEHDALFKRAFRLPAHAAGELAAVLPPELVHRIDLASLELVPGSFMNPELRERFTDALFRATFRDADVPGYVAFLIEHQSEPDRWMSLRVLEYFVRFWADLVRATPARPTLPPVVCVIVHHGESGWTTPRRLHELIEGLDIAPELRRFVPEFELVIDDLASQSDEVLEARPLPTFPKLALWLLRDGRNVEALLAHLSHWARQLERLDPAGEDFLVVMRYILWVAGDRPFEEIRKRVVTVVPAAEIPMASAAEQLIQEGVRRGEAKGRAEGEAQGKAEAVLDVLDARGLVVTAEQRARILACTDVAQLASWLRVAATAGSASELFAH